MLAQSLALAEQVGKLVDTLLSGSGSAVAGAALPATVSGAGSVATVSAADPASQTGAMGGAAGETVPADASSAGKTLLANTVKDLFLQWAENTPSSGEALASVAGCTVRHSRRKSVACHPDREAGRSWVLRYKHESSRRDDKCRFREHSHCGRYGRFVAGVRFDRTGGRHVSAGALPGMQQWVPTWGQQQLELRETRFPDPSCQARKAQQMRIRQAWRQERPEAANQQGTAEPEQLAGMDFPAACREVL